MIKIDLITGFLGAGKTTFIQKYARWLMDQGQKIGILENDYGAVNVDMMLLQGLEGPQCDLEMISGGCCADCHKRRFRTKLIAMGMLGYDRVLVEPSGIYDVDEFFDALCESPVDRWYEPGSVITILDACLEEDLSGEDLAVTPGHYGTIDKPAGDPLTTDTGRLTLPPEAFTRLPLPGEAVQRLRIRMNTPVLPIETEWAWIEGIADVGDSAVCDTPTLTLVSSDADRVVVEVGTTHDKDNPPDAVHVAFAGASEWHVAALGDEVTLPCPPLGAPITVQAYGTTDEGGVSGIATLEVSALPDVDWITIAPVDASAGNPVRMLLNVSSEWTDAAEMTTVKFSGRERESAFYGNGGSSQGTVSCDILEDGSHGSLRQSEADFRRLAYAGPCVLREPRGVRRYVSITSVNGSWVTVNRVKRIKVSAREVS